MSGRRGRIIKISALLFLGDVVGGLKVSNRVEEGIVGQETREDGKELT
jgi:hypothetical protein